MDSRGRKFQEERSWHDWYSALVHTRRRFAPRAAASRLSDYPLRFACVCDTIPPLTPDEYSTAIASLSATKDSAEYRAARERLITSHLREILSMAKDRPHYRLPVADYVGIGNLAVVRHFDEFVPERGAFSEFVRLVVNEIGSLLGTPETLADVLDEAKTLDGGATLPLEKVREALADLVSVWDVMFPVERYRLVQSIVGRITVWPDKVKIRFNPAGLEELVAETAK